MVGLVANLVGKSILILRPELVRKFMIIKQPPGFDSFRPGQLFSAEEFCKMLGEDNELFR